MFICLICSHVVGKAYISHINQAKKLLPAALFVKNKYIQNKLFIFNYNYIVEGVPNECIILFKENVIQTVIMLLNNLWASFSLFENS